MLNPLDTPDHSLQAPGSRPRVITFTSIAGAVSVTLFIASEIIVAAAAAVWSIAGYFHLSQPLVVLLTACIGAPAIWGCWKVAKLAFDAETDPANN
jgi:hypothetical protein